MLGAGWTQLAQAVAVAALVHPSCHAQAPDSHKQTHAPSPLAAFGSCVALAAINAWRIFPHS